MFVIFDIDGTLTTTGDEPRQDVIDALKADVQDNATEILIVSGRPVSRLEESQKFLEDNGIPFSAIYLQDFNEQSAPDVAEAFKAFKYSKLLEEYGKDLHALVDDDADAREAAAGMGIQALTPEQYIAGGHMGGHEDEAAYHDEEGKRAPAPMKDQIDGSDTNAPGSAKGKAGDIELTAATEKALQTKADDHNEAMAKDGRPDYTKVRVDSLRAVYRRGAGAFSTSHRPGIGRAQWAMARVNAFLFLARTGAPENPAYVGDNDLLNADHPKYAEPEDREARATYEVPSYIQAAAAKGLEWVEQDLGGDGLQPETIADAKELAAGRMDSDKMVRMAAWVRRHRQDWEGVPQNSDADNKDYPGPGAVAGYLWGVATSVDGAADRVLAYLDPLIAAENAERFAGHEKEVRSAPIGAFEVREVEGGQRIVSGYAALFNTPSAGLPFTEIIAPGAFKRTLSRAKRGEVVVKFLHGHDENRMLATTASGRLTLEEDAQGLRVEAKLDPANPEAAAVISNLIHEAKAMGWSFGFTIPNGSGDRWNGNERTLREIRLQEVSILSGSTPAYPATIGMAAVRKIAAPRLGVQAEALVDTLEAVRAGKDLTAEQTEMVDTIKSKLGVKPTAIHNSIADAQLRLARMMSEDI